MSGDATAELIARLADRGLTLAVAESLTGGALSAELIRPAGASRVVVGAVVAYDTRLKHGVLGVDAELLAEHGPVHPEVARQMAFGVRHTLEVDGRVASIGVSTTGVAGPDPQGGQAPGRVYVGLSSAEASAVVEFCLDGNRDEIRRAAVDATVHLLDERF